MRILFTLATTALLLSLAPTGPQIQIKTEEHSCQGQSDWDTLHARAPGKLKFRWFSSLWRPLCARKIFQFF
jgi:hypothetical protein